MLSNTSFDRHADERIRLRSSSLSKPTKLKTPQPQQIKNHKSNSKKSPRSNSQHPPQRGLNVLELDSLPGEFIAHAGMGDCYKAFGSGRDRAAPQLGNAVFCPHVGART